MDQMSIVLGFRFDLRSNKRVGTPRANSWKRSSWIPPSRRRSRVDHGQPHNQLGEQGIATLGSNLDGFPLRPV